MKNTFRKIVPFLLILALITGCGGSRKPAAAAAGTYKTSAAPRAAMADYAAADGAMGYSVYYEPTEEEVAEAKEAPAQANGAEPGSMQPTGRKIIRNAELSVQTREYDTFMSDLSGRIGASGGYIESSYASGNSYSSRRNLRSVNMTLRIPAEKLDMFLEGVCAMGNVLYKNVYSNDVTANYVDTQARLNALKTERDTLMGLLEKADKMEDIIVIYERISDVTYEIESYESRMRTYDDQIAYSTVNISVEEVERETQVVEETAWQEIVRRLGENLEDIGDSFKEFFIGFVSALPGLVLAALIVYVIFLIIRSIVRKNRKKAAAEEAKAPKKPAETKEKQQAEQK